MRGYPRRIATKHDLEIAMGIDPSRTKAWLQSAIDNREGWYVTGPVDSETDGITDDAHRVVDQGDEEPDWYQQEWGPMPGNVLDRIGVSVAEAEEML